MRRRALAWLTLGVAAASAAVGWLLLLGADLDASALASRSYVQDAIVAVVYPVVGTLIVTRRGNLIGWIFCATGVLLGATLLAGALVASARDPSRPIELAAWFETWAWIPAHGLAAILLLTLFPEGRFASAGRRLIGVAGMAAAGVTAAAVALFPDLRAELAQVRTGSGGSDALALFPEFRARGAGDLANPFGIEGAEPVLTAVGAAGALTVLACTLLAAAALLLRLRSARGEERQQLKWVAFAGAALAAGAIATIPLDNEALLAPAIQAILLGPIVAFAVGAAILRHRLYDIDVVINRTLVYGALTATLVGAYLAAVLLLQLALSPLTEDSDLAIAGSTLAVAALFRPARARIQAVVDRRFYRRRYDAARTLEGFGTRLRDEVDLDALGSDLRRVVAETMQPAHVSLWVRAAR